MKSLSRVWLFATPWTVAYQAFPSMRFSRQEYWSGMPSPSPKVSLVLCKIHLYGNSSLPDHTKTITLNNRNKLVERFCGTVSWPLSKSIHPTILPSILDTTMVSYSKISISLEFTYIQGNKIESGHFLAYLLILWILLILLWSKSDLKFLLYLGEGFAFYFYVLFFPQNALSGKLLTARVTGRSVRRLP